jgi:hypothetical protein
MEGCTDSICGMWSLDDRREVALRIEQLAVGSPTGVRRHRATSSVAVGRDFATTSDPTMPPPPAVIDDDGLLQVSFRR